MNENDPDPPDDDGDDDWIDVEDFDRDGAIRRFVQKHRGYRYAARRDSLQKQWEGLENQITAVYLENEVATLNWTTKASYIGDVSPDCQCHAGRSISLPVRFCKCLPEPIQLVHQGYIAASPKQPRTAFSITLLQQHHHLWLTTVAARSSYIDGHLNFLDKRSDKALRARGGRGTRRNLSEPFSSATHLFTRITVLASTLLTEGLQLRLQKTSTTIKEAQATLDHWCQKLNPYEPGRKYTTAFFRKQWQSERLANIENSKDIKIRQQIELGRLLCLEDLHYKVWLEDGSHEQRAAERLERVQQLGIEIAAQRQKVGLPDCFTHLPKDAFDLLLKVWFAKTEVRTRFLALRAEQRPLDPENRVGGSSHLGTHEKERIMDAIQKRTRTMKKILSNYNYMAQQAMRWATTSFDRLWNILEPLSQSDILPESVQPFLEHDILSSASLRAKVSIVKGVLHNELTRIAELTLRWDFKIKQVYLKTEAQVGDLQLMTRWQWQLQKMEELRLNGFGSTKAGDFEHLMPTVPVRHDIIPQGVREGGPEEPDEVGDGDVSDINEEEWAQGIDEGMMRNILEAIGHEVIS
ncbi:uncharacterized protein MELLADRAFT_103528 [Melampsora larici-populina 98AG31]|uniref:CxC1-like cysteine cluster associated with KDZ transposases domain-containing protein n=1 Tax=Melampsora larici-populina (strain 98AG31 / pathotype 3-4-7) TaxID=747676 RepID=F4RBM5_MELLP|nr:uncharacterized protein MELLADRAFT_103528 [Melampsora larici-populina 98AG31]EGG10126.1 hypothetical protein MELLADRAFT_103528 [Melampsora larici-populina 98AG31]